MGEAGIWRMAWRTALDLLFPRACAACGGTVGAQEGYVCGPCLLALAPVVEPFCARCGDPIDGEAAKIFTCSTCVKSEPAFDLARSACRYRGPLKPLLREYKYHGGTHLAGDLARLLAVCVETHYDPTRVDLVAGVPLYHKRERERAYNQAKLLAEHVGRRLDRPVLRGLRRIRDTGTQTRLNMAARAANVKDAFAVTDPGWVRGKTVLLVDDVMTTGATLREVASALKAAGAWRVLVATVARG